MDAPTGPHLSRELSSRQREVAALIAAGKTNGEIAEELGISLQGAKYHVSELLRALDLDTREEVAEWWRQQRGMRARFAVTARWSRMPALVKWGLGGAAAAGVAVVAVFALEAFIGGEDQRLPRADELLVAYTQPTEWDCSYADGYCRGTDWNLRLAGAEDRLLASGTRWEALALSNDGRHLAGLEAATRQSPAQIHVFDLRSGDSRNSSVPEPVHAIEFVPETGRLIAFHVDGAIEFDVDLNRLREASLADGHRRIPDRDFRAEWNTHGELLLIQITQYALVFNPTTMAFVQPAPTDEIAWLTEARQVAGARGPSFISWAPTGELEVLYLAFAEETSEGYTEAWTFRASISEQGEMEWDHQIGDLDDAMARSRAEGSTLDSPDEQVKLFRLGSLFGDSSPVYTYLTVETEGALRDEVSSEPGLRFSAAWEQNEGTSLVRLPLTIDGDVPPPERVGEFHGIVFTMVALQR